MKASVLYGINDLQYVDREKPELKKDEVLVNVKCCGICGSDVARVFTTGTYHFPTVIGHEFSGVVTSVENDNHSKWIGKRVGVFPLKPCFNCPSCRKKSYETCDNYDYLGSRCDGGFQQYVSVPEWNLIELPNEITFEEAAMLEPTSVAIHALGQVDNLKDMSVVIIGPGMIGNVLAAVAKAKGASRVIMIGRTEAKLEFAKTHSADEVINSTTENVKERIDTLTSNIGADIVVEGTGASESLALAIDIIKKGGSLILMGNPLGDMNLKKADYWKLLRKQLHVHGTWNSSFKSWKNDWEEAIKLIVGAKLDLKPLISHKLKFDQLLDGLNIMRDSSIYSNKVMLENNE